MIRVFCKIVQVLFGGGLQNFKLMSEGGKRLDTDLVNVWKEKKKEKGDDAQVLLNTGDLKSWTESDYVLGETSLFAGFLSAILHLCVAGKYRFHGFKAFLEMPSQWGKFLYCLRI